MAVKIPTMEREGTHRAFGARVSMPSGESIYDLARQMQADPVTRATLAKANHERELAALREESMRKQNTSKKCSEASKRRWEEVKEQRYETSREKWDAIRKKRYSSAGKKGGRAKKKLAAQEQVPDPDTLDRIALARLTAPAEDIEVLVKVCERLGLRPASVLMRCRHSEVVRFRWEIMKILYEKDWITHRIARVLGLKNHATVVHGLKQ